jgi:para-nitrobenzyl esterase
MLREGRLRGLLTAVAVGAVACLGAAGLASCATATADPAVAQTETGTVHGVVADSSRTFSGIPYAAPPVGDLRWRAPQPEPAWSGIREATRPGQRCLQLGEKGGGVTGSEDCLYLNVTAPAPVRPAPRPVMVWIPGGGFVNGAGSDYNSTRLTVQGDVVVVTVNYRLGALGFLAHPALAAEDPLSGNYGLADQQAALRWVRANIAAFGGDPRNVTVFGQSAGGYSVCAHLAAPGSRGLFEKAIVQSGPCGNALLTRGTAEDRGLRTAAQLACPQPATAAACLRAVSPTDLVPLGADQVFTAMGLISDLPWMPVAGTPALPVQPLTAMQDGTAALVPLIQGSTRDEVRPFIGYASPDQQVTAATYPTTIGQIFGADAPAVLARYPLSDYSSPGLALASVLTDWGGKFGACPVLPADDAASQRAPVFAYEWSQDSGARTPFGFPLGASHGAEVSYLLDFSEQQGGALDSAEELALSQNVITYWTRFARTGDPNTEGVPHWPAYRPGRQVLSLASGPAGIVPVDFARNHQCSSWPSG